MNVIALTGRAGSGKDTTAQILQYILDSSDLDQVVNVQEEILDSFESQIFSGYNDVSNYHILKFAWPVYQIVGILLNRNPEMIMLDRKFKDTIQYKKLTGRQLLQKVGTECFRDVIGTDIWLDIMDRHLSGLYSQGNVDGVIISDLWFVNEAEFLAEKWKATIIKMAGRDSGVPVTHPSEAEISLIEHDHYLYNSGTLVQLAVHLNDLAIAKALTTNKYYWK